MINLAKLKIGNFLTGTLLCFISFQINAQDSVTKENWGEMQANMTKSMRELETNLSKMEAQFKKQETNFGTQFQKQMLILQNKMDSTNMQFRKEWERKTKLYNNFLDALQHDGLLHSRKNYDIELKGGFLYINKEKETKETTEKYRRYYDGANSLVLKS